MSQVMATGGRRRNTAVRGLRALRDAHDEMVYLWKKLLTMRQAPQT